MTVFLALKQDDRGMIEILGVFWTKENAMKYAEEQEPGREFKWVTENDDNAHIHPFRIGVDPIYSYFVERQDVR